jgi:uncharacterized Tic20 family protein
VRKHLLLTLIGLLFMAAIGIVGTFIVSSHDKKVSETIEKKGQSSLSSFVSSIIDRINGK